MFWLSKIAPLVFLPVGVALILLTTGLVFRRRRLIVCGLVVFWVCSLPLVGRSLVRALEGGAERIPAAAAVTADAIVVLSGGRPVAPGRAAISEWTDGDRFWAGIELFQAGRAPLLVFTGGWSPAQQSEPEGEILARYAAMLGVRPEQIAVTSKVLNTADEAQAVAAILKSRTSPAAHIILVTSASHMRRAGRLFRSAGLTVSEFPVDFADATQASVLDLVPTASALAQTQFAIRELYGRAFYRLASWW